MVDPEDVAVRRRQEVAALAIGVVDRGVEHGDPAQSWVVVDDHRDHVDRGIDVDPELQGAVAERPVAADRRRDDRPAHRLADEICGDLAMGKGFVGEIVEGTLAGGRLVDRLDRERLFRRGTRPADPAEHRVVR